MRIALVWFLWAFRWLVSLMLTVAVLPLSFVLAVVVKLGDLADRINDWALSLPVFPDPPRIARSKETP